MKILINNMNVFNLRIFYLKLSFSRFGRLLRANKWAKFRRVLKYSVYFGVHFGSPEIEDLSIISVNLSQF